MKNTRFAVVDWNQKFRHFVNMPLCGMRQGRCVTNTRTIAHWWWLYIQTLNVVQFNVHVFILDFGQVIKILF
jgi:hypothetical protein